MKRIVFVITISCLTLMSCNKKAESKSVDLNLIDLEVAEEVEGTVEAVGEESDYTEKSSESTSIPIENINKKLIKNGSIHIEVGDINKAKTKVESLITKHKAYNQNEMYFGGEQEDRLTLEIRIPHQNFDLFMKNLSNGIGFISRKSVDVEDVTEEYTDVSIRLKNKLTYLEKYRDLVKKTNSTKEILEIQEKIRTLEEEIESSKGKLRYMDDRVNYSTLTLTLTKEKPRNTITSKVGFGTRFFDAITNGWNGFINFTMGVITLWPFFLLLIPLFFGYKKWKKRKK